jgi:hypothetical protein
VCGLDSAAVCCPKCRPFDAATASPRRFFFASPSFAWHPNFSLVIVPAMAWPAGIERLDVRSGVAFRDVTNHLQQCSCIGGCFRGFYVNAEAGIFCNAVNCGAGASCGNRCRELACLQLVVRRTGLGVASTLPLPANVCVGEYCGVLRRGAEITRDMEQSTFRFEFAERSASGERICVDAARCGSLCRFMIHSDVANCHLEVMANRCARKVAVVTCEFVPPGDDLTLSYRDRVW